MTTVFANALFLFMTLASVTAISGMTKIYDEYAGKRHETLRNEDGDVCLVPPKAIDEDDCETKHSKVGMLDPYDIANLTVYKDWKNETMTLNGETIPVAKGHITWPLPLGRKTKFSVLPSLFPREKIDKVLGVLRRYKNFDGDIDSVDRMPTHEIFVHNGDKYGASKPHVHGDKTRLRVRKKLRKMLKPIEDKITAIVRATWPERCNRKKKMPPLLLSHPALPSQGTKVTRHPPRWPSHRHLRHVVRRLRPRL